MAEWESKLQRSFWAPADLRLFYKAAFPEDGLPRYALANPGKTTCCASARRRVGTTWRALHDTGLIPTGDGRSGICPVYELAHGRAAITMGWAVHCSQSTTATLRLADWSREPKEHAGISATNQPGDVISVRQGAVTYAVPAPDLRTAEGWKEFVKKAKDAVH